MQQLAESEKLYKTILNSVSHELRTPLTAIMGNASALLNCQIASDHDSRVQLSQDIMNSADRLNRVVSNLLDMSRLSSGTLSLTKDWHEAADLVAVALEAQKSALAGHHVTTQIEEGLPLVRVDFQLLSQALRNLLINAASYTPQDSAINVTVKSTGKCVELSVSDNGPGLPKDSLAHLFEMFYRVPGSPAGGTGIGLAIAKGVVEAHGGSIRVINRSEGGACFTISLPLDPQPQMPREQGEP